MPLYIVYQAPTNPPAGMPSPVAASLVEADNERDAVEAVVQKGNFVPGVVSAVSAALGKDFEMTLAADLEEVP